MRTFGKTFGDLVQQGTGLSLLATLKLASDLLPTKGSDSVTYSRTGIQCVPDHEGVYRPILPGNAGFPGTRTTSNLFTYSEDFSNSAWQKNYVTLSTESIAGPVADNVTATKITCDGTTAQHYLSQTLTVVCNNLRAIGFLVKKGTARYVSIFIGGMDAPYGPVFDFDTTTFIEPILSTTQKFWAHPQQNGWVWLYISEVKLTGQTNTTHRLYPQDTSTFSLVTTQTSTVYVLKAQMMDISGASIFAPIDYIQTTATSMMQSFATKPNNQQISFWGDSLTLTYPEYVQQRIVCRNFNRHPYPGETSDQILSHFINYPERFLDITIIWSGTNNWTDPVFDNMSAKANIASMVAALGHTRFIILTPINGEYPARYSGTPGFTQFMDFINWILSTYPNNSIDIRAYLLTQGTGTGQDATDVGHGIIPVSLRVDPIHLTVIGYTKVAIQVNNFIRLKGWLSDAFVYADIAGLNGILLEPARTNYVTAYGLNDTAAVGAAPSGMTKSGNATATLKAASSTAFLTKIYGLGSYTQGSQKAYELDNSLGGSGDAIVTIAGGSATSPQSYSVYAQVSAGSATLQNDSAEGAVTFNNVTPAVIKSENVTVAGARLLQLVAPSGTKITFSLMQLEVGTKCTSFIVTAGATAARAATTATLPIPVGATKAKTTETKSGVTADVIRNIADYISTIKVGTANDGIYIEPVQIKDLKSY